MIPGMQSRLSPGLTGTSQRETSTRIVTALAVIGSTVFLFFQLRPDLLFSTSMDVGGDTAAHVAANYYFIHDLLPHGQLSGWDPGWFGGFPLFVYYFPFPAVLTAVLSGVIPFATAFKIITLLGTLLLPTAGYLFGRLAGFSRPVPALMSVATLAFLFNTSYTIDGGDIASTLAGEYSFSLSLVFALLFLGVVIYALRTGRLRWLAPILFALTVLSHVVPALFAAGAAGVIVAIWPDRMRALRIVVPVGVVGGLLAAFWLLRFVVDLPYSSSMGYTRVGNLFNNLFPASGELAVPILACIGLVYGIFRGQRMVIALAIMAVGSALAFQFLPSGLVFNGRWLPFWFLTTALIAAYAVGELGSSLLGLLGFRWLNASLTPGLATLATVAIIAGYLGDLPFDSNTVSPASFIPSWVAWNYSGYQSKPGWPNFQRLTSMLESAAKTYGCGRLDYEYSPNFNGAFGSTLVPMSFPMWTNGCIQTTEGLYYESSTSTPFHFLDQAELSVQPSNPVVGIPYQSLNVSDGVAHLQLTGVHYFLANSSQIEGQAQFDPTLKQIASIPADPKSVESAAGQQSPHPKWVLYLIQNSTLVRPLYYDPVVESGISSKAWLKTAIRWYQNETDWPVVLTTTGQSTWQHVSPGKLVSPSSATEITPTTVSKIRTSNSMISFNVGRIGSPVVVNVPYFPNWKATGATGPYYASPNMMVVVPTSHHVVVSYQTTTSNWIGRVGSIVGLLGLIALRTGIGPDPHPLQSAPQWVGRINDSRQNRRRTDEDEGENEVDEPNGEDDAALSDNDGNLLRVD